MQVEVNTQACQVPSPYSYAGRSCDCCPITQRGDVPIRFGDREGRVPVGVPPESPIVRGSLCVHGTELSRLRADGAGSPLPFTSCVYSAILLAFFEPQFPHL